MAPLSGQSGRNGKRGERHLEVFWEPGRNTCRILESWFEYVNKSLK